MTEILKPESGESIYDPTCGSAGMLISATVYLKSEKKEWRNVSLYGQEVNSLTSAIGRMNLFLHGIEDFHIFTGDTLAAPAFIEGGKLKTFDCVLANPPYSVKQWNRDAFKNDKYGRNFLGLPPQGRADYAFFQHILKSMDDEKGRCAILFPHGVLFRAEEKSMRANLIRADLVDCVIGIGANLFYNSPMEACVVVCRSKKPKHKQGKIFFINAVNEVTRKNAQSYLESRHIEKFSSAYENYQDVKGFARIVSLDEIERNNFSLNVPFYVRDKQISGVEENSLKDYFSAWKISAEETRLYFSEIDKLLKGGEKFA